MKDFVRKILKKNVSRWFVLVVDLYIVLNTFFFAYLIRFNFTFYFDTPTLWKQLPVVSITAILGFLISGSYKGIIRHTGLRDMFNIFFGSLFMLTSLEMISYINMEIIGTPVLAFSNSILIIHFLLNVILLTGSRFIFKELYRFLFTEFRSNRHVLIYGAGETGLLTYSVLKDLKDKKIEVVAFMDDNKRKSRLRINGIPVLLPSKVNQKFMKEKDIDEIIISMQNISSNRLMEIVDTYSEMDVKVKIVPPAKTWVAGNLSDKQIKNVSVDDLLGRTPIKLDCEILSKEFSGKTILVTGAAGSIGSEISRQLENYNCEKIVLIDQAESELYNLQQYFKQRGFDQVDCIVADVRNRERLELLFENYRPQIVFHAAAYKHVPFMEENPYEAVNVNVKGSANVADLSNKYEVEKFIMISTDKAVNPTNVMGATKRIAEKYVSCLQQGKTKTKFITTRFGNVLGSNGSVIPLFKKQIENGGPLTVTHEEITRYFMTIPEACQLVLEAGAMGNGGEIFVFDMGESVKIIDLAKNMIHLSGLHYPGDIDIKITGLRPGEKIYEELLADGENNLPTHHEKIMIAKVAKLNCNKILPKIEDLFEANNTMEHFEIVKKMKSIVPEFKSNNSQFESLDVNNIKSEKLTNEINK